MALSVIGALLCIACMPPDAQLPDEARRERRSPPGAASPGGESALARRASPQGRVLEALTVLRIIDGDTIVVGGLPTSPEFVRLIGINSPETGHGRPRECFAGEAKAWLRQLLPVGTAVRLEMDVDARDAHGRLLGYVLRSDGLFVNGALVENGFAQVATYPPNVRYVDEFLRLQELARSENRGLWGECDGGPLG